MTMLNNSILSEAQQELLDDMTYKLEINTLREIERLAKNSSGMLGLENMPLSLLLRVALENVAEKHIIGSSYSATYDYLKNL